MPISKAAQIRELEKRLRFVRGLQQACRAYVAGGDEGLDRFLDQHFKNLRAKGLIRNEGPASNQPKETSSS